jgi:ATP-dependent Clp protease protease subunit
MADTISLGDLIQDLVPRKPNCYEEFMLISHHISREIYVEDIDGESLHSVFRLIKAYNNEDSQKNIPICERKPIKIYINSLGGSLTDGYGLVDIITMSETPVYTIGIATAYSAGALILVAGHKRFMYPKASFMLHEGSAFIGGDAGKVKDTMKFYDKQLEIGREFILKRSRITPELYDQKQANDWYFTADECLSLGIVDEISTTI